VLPAVAEVERASELVAELEPVQLGRADLDGVLGCVVERVGVRDAGAVGEDELAEVGEVPATEREVDGVGELLDLAGPSRREHAPRPRPGVLATPVHEVHTDARPGLRHLLTLGQRAVRPGRHDSQSQLFEY